MLYDNVNFNPKPIHSKCFTTIFTSLFAALKWFVTTYKAYILFCQQTKSQFQFPIVNYFLEFMNTNFKSTLLRFKIFLGCLDFFLGAYDSVLPHHSSHFSLYLLLRTPPQQDAASIGAKIHVYISITTFAKLRLHYP